MLGFTKNKRTYIFNSDEFEEITEQEFNNIINNIINDCDFKLEHHSWFKLEPDSKIDGGGHLIEVIEFDNGDGKNGIIYKLLIDDAELFVYKDKYSPKRLIIIKTNNGKYYFTEKYFEN